LFLFHSILENICLDTLPYLSWIDFFRSRDYTIKHLKIKKKKKKKPYKYTLKSYVLVPTFS